MKVEASTPFLFPGRDGKKARSNIDRWWREIREEAGIPDVTLHDLRHTHASFLVNDGVPLPVIGALLGHSTPQVTARYAHLYDDTLREAAGKFGKRMRRGTS